MDAYPDPVAPTQHRRRRDRRGRGLRAPLLPASAPGFRSRRERFEALAARSIDRLAPTWRARLPQLQFLVADVPDEPDEPSSGAGSGLGRYLPPHGSSPARIVLFRRPIESRCVDDSELGYLLHFVVGENLANALGIPAHELDPDFDD